MQVVDSPQALPGSCAMPGCGSAMREKYIDTELHMEFHGAVYICDLCLGEMARLMGFLEPEHVDRLKVQLDDALTEQYILKRELDGLRMALDGFTLARGARGIDTIPDTGVFAQVVASQLSESVGSVDDGTSRTPEQVHDQGVAEFPDDATGDEFRLSI